MSNLVNTNDQTEAFVKELFDSYETVDPLYRDFPIRIEHTFIKTSQDLIDRYSLKLTADQNIPFIGMIAEQALGSSLVAFAKSNEKHAESNGENGSPFAKASKIKQDLRERLNTAVYVNVPSTTVGIDIFFSVGFFKDSPMLLPFTLVIYSEKLSKSRFSVGFNHDLVNVSMYGLMPTPHSYPEEGARKKVATTLSRAYSSVAFEILCENNRYQDLPEEQYTQYASKQLNLCLNPDKFLYVV